MYIRAVFLQRTMSIEELMMNLLLSHLYCSHVCIHENLRLRLVGEKIHYFSIVSFIKKRRGFNFPQNIENAYM